MRVERLAEQRIGDRFDVLQIRLDFFDHHDVVEFRDAIEKCRGHVKLGERRIVIHADRHQVRFGDGLEVVVDFELARFPVIRRDDDGAFVAEVGRAARPLQRLERGRAGGHCQRNFPRMRAHLIGDDLEDALPLVVFEMQELTDRRRGDDPGGTVREAPIDLRAQRALVDGIRFVERRDEHADHVFEAVAIALVIHAWRFTPPGLHAWLARCDFRRGREAAPMQPHAVRIRSNEP